MSIAALGASSAYAIRPMTSRAAGCASDCGCDSCSSTRGSTRESSATAREDSFEISAEASALAERERAASATGEAKIAGDGSSSRNEEASSASGAPAATNGEPTAQSGKSTAQSGKSTAQNDKPLDETQQKEVAKLKDRDREVRQHEAAHLAAAGGHATGGPSFTYEKGPDGKQYAVGGEVNVDTSEEKTPEATLRKMQQIQRAALAPAEPSGQDHSVAAAASQKAAEARREIAAKHIGAAQSGTGAADNGAPASDSHADAAQGRTQAGARGTGRVDSIASGTSTDSHKGRFLDLVA